MWCLNSSTISCLKVFSFLPARWSLSMATMVYSVQLLFNFSFPMCQCNLLSKDQVLVPDFQGPKSLAVAFSTNAFFHCYVVCPCKFILSSLDFLSTSYCLRFPCLWPCCYLLSPVLHFEWLLFSLSDPSQILPLSWRCLWPPAVSFHKTKLGLLCLLSISQYARSICVISVPILQCDRPFLFLPNFILYLHILP